MASERLRAYVEDEWGSWEPAAVITELQDGGMLVRWQLSGEPSIASKRPWVEEGVTVIEYRYYDNGKDDWRGNIKTA
jgi:hypothetical protein